MRRNASSSTGSPAASAQRGPGSENAITNPPPSSRKPRRVTMARMLLEDLDRHEPTEAGRERRRDAGRGIDRREPAVATRHIEHTAEVPHVLDVKPGPCGHGDRCRL